MEHGTEEEANRLTKFSEETRATAGLDSGCWAAEEGLWESYKHGHCEKLMLQLWYYFL